jgi:integrase
MAAVPAVELPALLRAIDGYQETQTRLALQLMANVFLRTTELIAGEWAEVDFKSALWTVPGARMKMKAPHIVPLSRQSLAILRELQTINGDYRWIFPGRNPAKHISQNTVIFALYRLGYHSRQTGHGFRSIASTILNSAMKPNGDRKFHADWIERQLSHGDRDTIRAAYNMAEYLPQRVRMMQWYSDHLEKIKKTVSSQ